MRVLYKVKEGIFYKNGKKTFVLGESYYPSFHPSKYPVMPDGDRIGEMKKDLKMMAEAGFNHVRFAALGEIGLDENGKVSVSTPFIDAMTEEADKNEISVSIREQGFAVNLRNFENVEMIDQNGVKPDYSWCDFIRTTLNHKGILEDNRTYSKALAKHYDKFKNVIGFQIYNEPKYPMPQKRTMDYHPETIKAYRKWLFENDYMTENELSSYEPPRSQREQDEHMWALWRIFSRDNLTAFLNNASRGSKEGSKISTFTCFTSAQISSENVNSGDNMFDNAKEMDIVGYTSYLHSNGLGYYPTCLQADLAQCAAELEHKQSWCIELDSRTYIPLSVYNRSTYALLGAGCKGIIYYQWRGDCPAPGVPYPNSCGILNYDGTKTANFDNALKVNRCIIHMNDLLMNSNRIHEGIGLLHSDYASYLCDARENDATTRINKYIVEYTEIYRQLRSAGHNVSITDAEHLKENPFNIKVLYVPHLDMLSEQEARQVEILREKGVRIFEISYTRNATGCIAFKEYPRRAKTYEEGEFDPCLSVYDVVEITKVKPLAVSLEPEVEIQMLEGEDYKLIVLTNISAVKKEMPARLRINIPFKSVEFTSIDGDKNIEINNKEITIENISDGGIIILR